MKLLHEDSAAEFLSYMIPGLIYFVNNNTVFLILQAVDPTTFQLLSQLKTIFTGLLFRVFLKRHRCLTASGSHCVGLRSAKEPTDRRFGRRALCGIVPPFSTGWHLLGEAAQGEAIRVHTLAEHPTLHLGGRLQ